MEIATLFFYIHIQDIFDLTKNHYTQLMVIPKCSEIAIRGDYFAKKRIPLQRKWITSVK